VFTPIIDVIRKEHILNRFPGRTEADLYVWIVRHWDELKKKKGGDFPLDEAAKDYTRKYGKTYQTKLRNFVKFISRIFKVK
ncbi:MAG: transcriptional regulator, partial [Spirochaetes bacterium]